MGGGAWCVRCMVCEGSCPEHSASVINSLPTRRVSNANPSACIYASA